MNKCKYDLPHVYKVHYDEHGAIYFKCKNCGEVK